MDAPQPLTEERVRTALEQSDGSARKAAEILGIHRVTVYKLIRRYGIKVTRTAKVA